MRSYFTNEDMANLLQDIYKDNTLEVVLKDQDTGEETLSDMVKYLDIEFFTWYEHAKSAIENQIDLGESIYESWKNSLNNSIGKSYALIEQTDEETILSQDIMGATIYGKISFICNVDKIKNLEYYLRYLKSEYNGRAIKRETANGGKIGGYLTLGILEYNVEPTQVQVGEVIECAISWKFNYMQIAETYADVKFELSLDGTNYHDLIMSKYTWQNIFTKQAVPRQKRLDNAGFLVTSITQTVTISYWDFESAIANAISEIFWDLGAISIDGVEQTAHEINIPMWVRITKNNKVRVYKKVITNMEKVFTNNDFTIASITLNTWGKN